MASLNPKSFDLDTGTPTVTLATKRSKSKKGLVVQPLPAGAVSLLRHFLEDRPADKLLWPGNWTEDAAEMLQHDLASANIPYVIEGPDGPLYADFHSLRHSFVAMLEEGGVSLKQAMALARHSDPKLTMARYGRAQLSDLSAAIKGLPIAPKETPEEEQEAKATGTSGAIPLHAPYTKLVQAGDTDRSPLISIESKGEGAGE